MGVRSFLARESHYIRMYNVLSIERTKMTTGIAQSYLNLVERAHRIRSVFVHMTSKRVGRSRTSRLLTTASQGDINGTFPLVSETRVAEHLSLSASPSYGNITRITSN